MASQPVPDDGVEDVEAITAALLTASRLLVAISARSLAAVNETITVAQFRTLVVLSTRQDVTLSALAERMGVNPSTAMRMADRLSAAGLLVKDVNPANRRETSLRLTPAGRRVVEQVTAQRREQIAAIVARMPPPQRRGVTAALRAFTDAGGEPAIEPHASHTHPLGWT